ncbi:hypothetical protein [Aquibium sp. ELW1220]|uniref:hypothetical protein n=1 Tax=Aquibium sp. ELW1220 TaxID=2976766 RepID=UPI0025B1D07F|nr:hypothetical protein [Aquibium sp. ELW1220]MDN2579068.1 hypothetical protein [Aquibium sp. ELW1220]
MTLHETKQQLDSDFWVFPNRLDDDFTTMEAASIRAQLAERGTKQHPAFCFCGLIEADRIRDKEEFLPRLATVAGIKNADGKPVLRSRLRRV